MVYTSLHNSRIFKVNLLIINILIKKGVNHEMQAFLLKNYTERHSNIYQPNFILLRLAAFSFDTASKKPPHQGGFAIVDIG